MSQIQWSKTEVNLSLMFFVLGPKHTKLLLNQKIPSISAFLPNYPFPSIENEGCPIPIAIGQDSWTVVEALDPAKIISNYSECLCMIVNLSRLLQAFSRWHTEKHARRRVVPKYGSLTMSPNISKTQCVPMLGNISIPFWGCIVWIHQKWNGTVPTDPQVSC